MTEKTKTNKPSYIAYAVKDGANDHSFFTRIGAAFVHADGEGQTILIDVLPLNGKIVLRVPRENEGDSNKK